MRVIRTRPKHLVNLVVIITGLLTLLILPLFPGATGLYPASSQKSSAADPGQARTDALLKLYSELEAGAPFSEEEIGILRRFKAGDLITQLEADIVISRALYDFFVTGSELNTAQEGLLARYTQMVARRDKDVADLKTQLLNRRKAAAAAALPPNVPLVAPGNDLCAGAEVIPAAGPFPFLTSVTADITDATSTGDPTLPSCQTDVSRSIWYRFTPSTTATYSISTCSIDGTATTVDDTVMAIYTSSNGTCGGTFSELPTTETTDGCSDDECIDEELQAVLDTQLTAGTTYFIVVWEFNATPPTAGNTAVQLKVSQTLPPSNDTCATPTALVLDTPVAGSTEFANNNYQLSGSACFTGVGNVASTAGGRDVVYSFTAPFSDTYSIRVTSYVESGLSDLVLYSASTCPAAGGSPVTVLTCLAAANRGVTSTAEEILCRPLMASQQIHIFVDEASITHGSPFVIEVTRCASESEPNATPATADALRFGMEGSINTGGDVDFFSLGTPVTGSRVFGLVDGVAGNSTDFDLRITTTTDTLEYDDLNADTDFGFASPSVAGTILTGAPAFVRLNQSAAVAAEPYRLYTVVQPPIASATPESEPNDTTATADSASNNYFTGSLSGPAPSVDADVFSFFASAGDLIFLSLDADPLRDNTPINAALDLLNAGGAELVSVNDGGTASSTTSGAGSLTAVTPFSPSEAIVFRATTTGMHFARVTIGTSSTGTTGAGDYVLSITRNGVTGSCTFSLSPTSLPFSGAGGNGMTSVTTAAGCAWTAVSNDPSFITVTSGSPGTGNGTVNFSVAANTACSARTGTITIGGQTFTVTQDSGSCGDTIGLYHPASAGFFLRNSNTGGIADISFTYGGAGAGLIPLSGDWNGDGVDTIGLYSPSAGAFFLRNSNTGGIADIAFTYGGAGAGLVPLVGDWNGDGIDTVGLYFPAGAGFFLRNSNTGGIADITFTYGGAGAGLVPLAGDWNGDGIDTVGLYFPAGAGFFLRNSNTGGIADISFTYGGAGAGLVPLAGDWNGDGTDTIGLYFGAGAGFFLRNSNTGGIADISFTYGGAGAGLVPIIGDWNGQ